MNRLARVAVSAVSWILAILMSVIYGALITVYIGLRFQCLQLGFFSYPGSQFSQYLPLIGPAFTVVAIGAWILLALVFRRRKRDVNGLRRLACLVVLAIPLVYLAIDEPTSKPIYTRADIPPPAKDMEASYKTLMAFRRDGGLELKVDLPYASTNYGYPQGCPSNVLERADAIEKAWLDVGKGWEVIERLDSFAAIADLLPETPLDEKIPVLGFLHLRNTARACWRYSILKTEQGKTDEGVRALCRLHSVTRKAQPYSTTLVSKMIWIAIAKGNMQTAYHIADSSKCTPATLMMLSKSFPPLSAGDTSMRRPFIAECLWGKTMLRKFHSRDPGYFTAFVSCSSQEEALNPLANRPHLRVASYVIGPFLLNLNGTIRELEETWHSVLRGVSSEPPTFGPSADSAEARLRNPNFKNMVGKMLPVVVIPSLSKCSENAWKAKVLSDLLAVELHRRLGEKLLLTDAYTGKPYFVDEATGIPSSVGPDGKPGTADDINLGEWPQ
ncbi:MAG: hypothetical protein WCN95_12505 [bacterium]